MSLPKSLECQRQAGSDTMLPARADQTPRSAETLASLGRILASRAFRRSPRLSRFLQFLVQNVLNGSAANLKEYTIGVDVFDRDTSYDSRVDPIVRVEARRLREKLRSYYREECRDDSVRIEMPERGYVPNIRYADQHSFQPPVAATYLSHSVTLAIYRFSPGSNDDFSHGLTDELVCLLSGSGDFNVLFLGSALHSASALGGLRGSELRPVEFVVEGYVRRENAEVRVCVQLTSPTSGFCVWSQAYEMPVRELFEAQKYIASQIAGDLRFYVAQSVRASVRTWNKNETSAHVLYSEGRMFLNSRTQDGIHHSVECFRQLISSRPRFALAYAGLADAYSLGARYDVLPAQESWERARLAALDAVRMDYSSAEAHTSLGFVDLHYRRDWGSAEREFCTAILLNPTYAPARQWYGWLLAATGQQESAITAVRQAVEIDPFSPNAHADLALTLYFFRRYDEAIEQCRRTMTLQPGFYRAHQLIGMAYLQKGELALAVEHLESAVSLTKGTGRGSVLLAIALISMGRINEARHVFAKSIELRSSKASAIDFALFSAASGDLDGVFQWLEKAYQEQDAELLWLPVDPIYDKVRSDPRFAELLSRIGKPAVSRPLHELVLTADTIRQ